MISETNFKALNEIVTDEAELNKILGIIENEAKKQAKLIVKSDKVKAKAKAEEKKQAKLLAKAEKEAEKLQIEAFKHNAEMYIDEVMADEYNNPLMKHIYPKATEFYLDNVESVGFNKVRLIKYNNLKEMETNDWSRNVERKFKSMNKVKKYLALEMIEASPKIDLYYLNELKSTRANVIDKWIGERVLQ